MLAGLHFERALELDPDCAAATEHKDNLRRWSSADAADAAAATATAAGWADAPAVTAMAADAAAPSHGMKVIDRGADGGSFVQHTVAPVPSLPSSPLVAASSAELPGGGCSSSDRGEKNEESAVAYCGTVGETLPKTTEEGGAIFDTQAGAASRRRRRGKEEEETGISGATITKAAAICSASRENGVRAAGRDRNGSDCIIDGEGKDEAAFRRAVGAACENYRAGVVLHREAFLSSSREKFLRVLELLDIATGTGTETAVKGAPQNGKEEFSDGNNSPEREGPRKDGGRGEDLDRERERGLVGAGLEVGAALSRGESFDGGGGGGGGGGGCGAAAIQSMRVGCHLNIAASFLLRKTDFELAVDHCTRYCMACVWENRGRKTTKEKKNIRVEYPYICLHRYMYIYIHMLHT